MLVRRVLVPIVVFSLVVSFLASCAKAEPTPTTSPTPTKAAVATSPSQVASPQIQATATSVPVRPAATAAPKTEVLDPAKVLPKTMYWSALDVGNSAYVQAGLMADAFMKKYGVKVRIIPAGSGLGRVSTIKTGQAIMTMLTEEVFYATNGLYEYEDMGWGPQDLRVILGHPAATGFPVRADSGIKTPADWKGKRVAYVTGLASFTEPIEAALAFAGLTPKDVIRVEFPSVGAAYSSLKEGKADTTKGTPTAPALYELASSPFGCAWTQFDPNNKEGWARLNKIMPWTTPRRETEGAGISGDKPSDLWTFIYPRISNTSPLMTF